MSEGCTNWRDPTKLSTYLGLGNASELYEYITSDLFEAFFEYLLEDSILLTQKAAQKRGCQRQRGLELKSTQQALFEGERSGKVKYSAYRSKKADWTIGDHFTRFRRYMKYENARSN